jgi:hypothetical protein
MDDLRKKPSILFAFAHRSWACSDQVKVFVIHTPKSFSFGITAKDLLLI